MHSLDSLRQQFLDFFKGKGHTVYPSDSLVPQNDPSLLFTSAGMVQFKDMFLGGKRLPFKRAATSQKCLRTGDVDRVGTTNRHHTFFEMLGNFSFGDYFKKEAITWAWEFLTGVMNIPADKLYPSVYKDDEEAFGMWRDLIGIPAARISRFGEDFNFWPANAPSEGPNGPCGPCSEIYFDFGAKYGCSLPTCGVGCDCDRYVEIWNLVFPQFERRGPVPGKGELVPLAQKNIDTGMGLERLACVMQGVHSNFEIAEFQSIIKTAADLLKVKADEASRVKLWRIADHSRAVTFAISDGIGPSNEERGYVVRRILRGAVRDGYLLGNRQPFLHELVSQVVALWGRAYPEIRERHDKVKTIVRAEEEKFLETIEGGMNMLSAEITRLKKLGNNTLDGEKAFKLHSTYGFPIDVTRTMLAEQKLGVDQAGFKKLLEEDAERSREAMGKVEIFDKALQQLRGKFKPTTFTGWEATDGKGTVLAILKGENLMESAKQGEEVKILLDQTPFYGESGGEVGDAGRMSTPQALVDVADTKRPEGFFLHHAKISQGEIKVGDKVEAHVDPERRLNIIRNHDATHVLQAALRKILGTHVEQKGSLVAPEKLRFDFSHPKALTRDEIRAVEAEVNREILADVSIEKVEVPMAKAKEMGAIMFFGEKYGDMVRVVRTIDNYTIELCGGCHGKHTSTIGAFRIVSESASGAGIRRIEAVTGPEALRLAHQDQDLILEIAQALRATKNEVAQKVKALVDQVKELQKNSVQAASDSPDAMVAAAATLGAEKIVIWDCKDERKRDQIRSLMDVLIKQHKVGAAIVAARSEGKPFAIIGVRQDLVGKGLKAGAIAKDLSTLSGGSGGGRDHMAEFGMADDSRVAPAFDEFQKRVRTIVQNGN
jgi:alanyl-tRNA synthetase